MICGLGGYVFGKLVYLNLELKFSFYIRREDGGMGRYVFLIRNLYI